MWIKPTTLSGGATLIHASNQSNGQGTCLTMWGLTLDGFITVNVMDSSTNVISTIASFVLPINTCTHIAQTFTSTNGVRLYIDAVLVGIANVVTGRVVGPYVMIEASPIGTSYCGYGSIDRGQFIGSVDEFRVFRDELTATDICRFANPT